MTTEHYERGEAPTAVRTPDPPPSTPADGPDGLSSPATAHDLAVHKDAEAQAHDARSVTGAESGYKFKPTGELAALLSRVGPLPMPSEAERERRRQSLSKLIDEYEAENGAFTEEELAAAEARLRPIL